MKRINKEEWVQLENPQNHGSEPFVSISPLSMYFNAEGVIKFKLENKKSVSIFQSLDQMKCKLIFHDDEPAGSYKLKDGASHSKNCHGKRVACKKLIDSNRRLQKISHSSREDRIIPISQDDDGNILINCAPCFEHSIPVDDIRSIDIDQIGIYRCLDVERDVLYIGSGKIRNRVMTAKQNIDGVEYVEFSIIHDRNDAFYWEGVHLDAYIEKHGRKPYYNKILPPITNIDSLEVIDV